MSLTDEEVAAMNQQKAWFNDNLQYNAYLITPESSKMFPELSKDISLSDLKAKWQRVILLKGRVADYIKKTFDNCPNYLGIDEEGKRRFQRDKDNNFVQYISSAANSFLRDIMAICVTSQGMNARLLRQITENNTTISHSYDMDKKARKNIGD